MQIKKIMESVGISLSFLTFFWGVFVMIAYRTNAFILGLQVFFFSIISMILFLLSLRLKLPNNISYLIPSTGIIILILIYAILIIPVYIS